MNTNTKLPENPNNLNSKTAEEQTLKSQFFNFIKKLIQRLYQPPSSAHQAPIYSLIKQHNKGSLQLKQIPSETIAFLKQQRLGISESKMAEISYFIGSKVDIFQSKSAMQHFLTETIHVKSFFILLLNWMANSSLIPAQQKESSEQNFIQWVKTPIQGPQGTKINNVNQLKKKVSEATSIWEFAMEKLIFKQYFDKFSLMLNRPNFGQDVDQDYFSKLYERIFIKEEEFTWIQVFNLKPIFYSIALFKREKQNPSKESKSNDKFFRNLRQGKNQILKLAFIYVHKYFMTKDFVQYNIKKSKDQLNYSKSLSFQSYLPRKLGLSLEITLDYQEWFECFYVENKDKRPGILKAADKLYKVLNEESGLILSKVKKMEIFHISRLMYILTEKLQSSINPSPSYKLVNQFLKRQVSNFVQSNRAYEFLITELKYIIEQKSQGKKNTLNSEEVRQYILQNCSDISQRDLLPLFIAYFKIYTQRNQSSTQQFDATMQKMNKNYGITAQFLIQSLSIIKESVHINTNFLNFLNLLQNFNQINS